MVNEQRNSLSISTQLTQSKNRHPCAKKIKLHVGLDHLQKFQFYFQDLGVKASLRVMVGLKCTGCMVVAKFTGKNKADISTLCRSSRRHRCRGSGVPAPASFPFLLLRTTVLNNPTESTGAIGKVNAEHCCGKNAYSRFLMSSSLSKKEPGGSGSWK